MTMVIVDCDSCEVRGTACGDCVMSALLGAPETAAPAELPVLDADECRVLGLFADSGMLPPLRLTTAGATALDAETDVAVEPEQRRLWA